MLTSRHAAAPSLSWSAARLGAAVILTVMVSVAASTAARAEDFGDTITDTNCIGGWRGYNCVTRWRHAVDPYVRTIPEPLGEAERARIIAADRKWLARCRPVKMYDAYGVPRYRYAAPGCEFGFTGD